MTERSSNSNRDEAEHVPSSTTMTATPTPAASTMSKEGLMPDAVDLEKQQQEAGKAPVAEDNGVDPFEVGWEGEDDPKNPLNTPEWRKWCIVALVCLSVMSVTASSSVASFTYGGMMKEYHVGREVCVLSLSLFVLGLGVGPLFLGPISEFQGRQPVLLVSYLWFWLLSIPAAFANNIAVHLIFRFLVGFAGSAFLSVSGGTITDVFPNNKVATPIMLLALAPSVGPVTGPVFAGFINQHISWHWTYYVMLIWATVMLVLLVLLLPETLAPQLLVKKARALRKSTGDERYRAPVEKLNRSFRQSLKTSLTVPFILLFTQPMALLLDIWVSLVLGIIYLSFSAFPLVFQQQHNFQLQFAGLVFISIGVGSAFAACTQPYFNGLYARMVAKHNGNPPPECRLIQGMVGAILCPVGLLLFGLTSFKNVHWMVPIVMIVFFAWGMSYIYSSTFAYLVHAYRPVSASALASNTFLRCVWAAAFPLFSDYMYAAMGAVGGSCFLAGLLFVCAPLPFVFYRIGARLRERSSYAFS